MGEGVYGWASFITTWRAVALLSAAAVLCSVGFGVRSKVLGPCYPAPDSSVWYTPAEVREVFTGRGAHGRTLYAITEVTLDLIFPLVYGSLFAALIANVFPPSAARRLVFVPVLAVVADLAENVQLAYCAWTFDGLSDPPCQGAALATVLKSGLILVSTVLLVVGALRPPSAGG
jgi:hypothetical protein